MWGDAHDVVSFVEIDSYCRAILRKHWPEAPQHDDLRAFDARPFRGGVDLLTGGYPCQPFSTAGRRRGAEDDRHVWPEVLRVAHECRPRWCLFENVAGHVTLGLDDVLSDLEGAGYAAWPILVPAVAVGARHRRDRVWIMAHADDAGGQARDADRLGDGDGARADAELTEGRGRQAGGEGGAQPGLGGVADGLPAWLDEPADVSPVTTQMEGRPDRLRALGNAIVPAVAEEIMRAMVTADADLLPAL